MASSSSSSSSKRRRAYDVFLSFRGTDVRNNFVAHLYAALNHAGINTYIDSEELEKGEQITQALMEAIEESQIAIVVFSGNYASSSFCLQELTKIMERKKQKQLTVWPVFYKVEPREVRTPREIYKEAMAVHEDKFGNDSSKVKRWNEALLDAGSLSGCHFTDGNEADLIKRIVKEISMKINHTPLHVPKQSVGLRPRVLELESMLNLESEDDVLMIGLWGQGGIGKTTLAKALYNDIFRRFETSCFLANVRENSRDSEDLVSLQEKLLSELLPGKGLTVVSVDGGINLMQYRLCRKKVLLVLDDVNDIKQLSALAGDREWFGKGSIIIITTRDSHLLTYHEINQSHIYKVRTLKNCDALELFNKHAFVRNNKIVIRRDLVDSALRYANGLPLALEVLGSFLRGRREHEWESALNRLAKSPSDKINGVLKLSYDGLEKNEKEIFLDIACFFKGRSKKHIMKVLDSCDFNPSIGVQVLVEKSLIFEEGQTLQMHDLTQMMGMDIVKQECPDDPGRRSRLWLYDDVCYVLSGDMGTNAVKAICLDLYKPKEIYVDPGAFTNVRTLRVLIMINVHTTFQGPICLPNELRWFEWPECPWLPQFSSGPKKLVGLDLQRSNFQVVREQFKDFKKLKFINFSECKSVVCIPDLCFAPYLVELDLHGCKNLEHLPDMLQSKNLQILNLNDCSKLQRFPDIPNEIKGLQSLDLKGTAIEELPASIENFVSLKHIDVTYCKKLEILPSSIYRLGNLRSFWLDGCSKLIHFPKKEEDWSDPRMKTGFPKLKCLYLERCNLSEVEFLENHSCFPSLEDLDLSGNNFTDLPTCEQLYELKSLNVSDCQGLQEILNIPRKLLYLDARCCKSLTKIPSSICGVDSCHELVRNRSSTKDFFKPKHFCHKKINESVPLLEELETDFVLPGGEMPDWLVPSKEGYIFFMASKELLKEKFIALAVCVVFREKEEPKPRGPRTLTYDMYFNGTLVVSRSRNFGVDTDHVWLWYSKFWNEGPNGWNKFELFIRASRGGIVKKCGFRLICKPLGNDLEVLLQHNPLMDLGLLHEVWHYDGPTSTMEESSYEREDLLDSKTSTEENSSSNLVIKGSSMADFSIQKRRYSRIYDHYRNVHPGGEMPEEFVLVEDDTICFMASQDLYDKFLGLALWVVFDVEDEKKEISFDIVPHVNSQRRNVLSGTLSSFDSGHVWFQYLESNVLWGLLEGGVDFGEFDERYLQFSLRLKVLGGIVKKLGYVIRCRHLEDDLKAMLEDNQLVNLASLCEDSQEPDDYEWCPCFNWPIWERLTEYRCNRNWHKLELGRWQE